MRKSLVEAIIKRDGLRCSYCGQMTVRGQVYGDTGTVIEHMTKDRSEAEAHLCVSCRRCNSKKGSLSVFEYLGKIDAIIDQAERLKIERIMVLEAINKMKERENATSN